ncbi:hypothetical protein GGX14DRAFT_541970 [Mycena pura]|uniref:Uncharacterized protein n=1 Tax=Mycena pura TaxID=153505 RepID=A0AAD6VKS1_9AGAR|nr:hypothetical protein GGX14DRAFT_541970 [Mycena pura]
MHKWPLCHLARTYKYRKKPGSQSPLQFLTLLPSVSNSSPIICSVNYNYLSFLAMSHFPGFHANGEPINYGRGAFGPGVPTNPDPSFPPRQRAQEVQSTAPAPSAQHPPTRPIAAARQMPPPSAIPPSDFIFRRPVAQSTALFSPPAQERRRIISQQLQSAFPGNHRPAPFAVAISGTAATGYRWPASSPSSIVRADQVAPPCADATDAWHNTSAGVMNCYPRFESYNTEVPITITFATTHGPGLVGVALTELARGRGVLEPDTPIGNFIMPTYQWAGPSGRLVFEWPGYVAQLTRPLVLQDANGRYVSRAAFGRQIACHLHEFIETTLGDPNTDYFKSAPPQTRLGRHGIRFEQFRLLEIPLSGMDDRLGGKSLRQMDLFWQVLQCAKNDQTIFHVGNISRHEASKLKLGHTIRRAETTEMWYRVVACTSTVHGGNQSLQSECRRLTEIRDDADRSHH